MFGFASRATPSLPKIGLSGDEKALIQTLQSMTPPNAAEKSLARQFYLAEQTIKNLRIAIPKELEAHLSTVLGWGATAVDPLAERISLDGLRTAGADDADGEISELLEACGFAGELAIAITDALSYGNGLITVGTNSDDDSPLVTAQDPESSRVLWDGLGRNARASWHPYADGADERAVLMQPKLNLHLAKTDRGDWELVRRDEHSYDFVPVRSVPNRPLSNRRHGRSEIGPALQALITDASRQMRALAIAGELAPLPQKLILGAAEAAFQKSDGSAKSAMETFLTSVLVFERDDEGNLPDVKQLQPYDPSVFTKVIELYGAQASGLLAAVPQDLGLYTEGNPPSAEAVAAGESRRDRRAENRQTHFGGPVVRVVQDILRFRHGGVLPDKYRRLSLDWNPVGIDTPAQTTDAITKQIAAGSVPATSDVVLRRLRYTATERRRLEEDRRRERLAADRRAVMAQMGGTDGISDGRESGS